MNLEMPAEVKVDRDRFLSRCSATPAFRAQHDDLARALDRLIEWSLARTAALVFASRGDKDQETIEFRKCSDHHVFWKAYPGGEASQPKVEFLTRASTYLTPDAVAEFRRRLERALGSKLSGSPASVPGIPLRLLASPHRFESVAAFLDWALAEPTLQDGRTRSEP